MDMRTPIIYGLLYSLLIYVNNHFAPCCTLPTELQGTWQDASLSKEITFTSNKLTGYDVSLIGSPYSSFTCISNIGTVYVFKGDSTYYKIPYGNFPFYLCMKFVKVSSNLYYYHLLSDPDGSGSETTGLRIYLPLNFGVNGPDPATTPTCDYCSFTNPHAESESIILQKSGTSETIAHSEATLCLPCDSDCTSSDNSQDPATESNIPVIVGSTFGAVVGVTLITALVVILYKTLIVKGSESVAPLMGT